MSIAKTTIERGDNTKEKTGVKLDGVMAINPINQEQIPVYVADYVLSGYGTGAIMAVPAHDERDYEFATKFNLPIKEVVRPYVVDHVNAPREDKETIVRENVHAIVRDPKTDTYLILRNAEHGWDTVVIGGIENGEDPIQAALREIREETGYTNLKYIRTLGNPVQAGYFAKHKDQNRVAISTCVYFELVDDTREEVTEDEGNEILWIDKKDFVPGKMINSELSIWLERLSTEKYVPFFGKGVLINSSTFDGLSSEEAKEKIAQAAGGKIKSQYKLRDWVFARQRYWGEPFPVVFDENHNSYVVADSELPVVLPDVENYEPTGTGESPLSGIEEWVNVYGYINEENEFVSVKNASDDIAVFIPETGLRQENPEYRKSIVAIVYDEVSDKYISINWGNSGGNLFIGGGVDQNEDIVEAARREIIEETGYVDIEFIKKTQWTIKHNYFAYSKNVARRIECDGLLFTLKSQKKVDQVLEENEKGKFTVEWVNKSFIKEKIKDELHSLCFSLLVENIVIKQFKHETNTMPQWAGSSWYYLRYIDPHNAEKFVEPQKEKKWSPVDFYVGGAEHATRHLIYARFWHKFLYDHGYVSGTEPFKKLQTVGLILAEDGRKMSKRWGNVVNPDDVIREYGADTLRLYEMFMGPFDGSAIWNTKNISGSKRFLDRVWKLQEKISEDAQTDEVVLNSTIKKVTEDIVDFKLNTAISAMMIALNSFEETGLQKAQYEIFIKLLAPFAPHITEEIWSMLGNSTSIHLSDWPTYDPSKLLSDKVTISVQVNGKLRSTISINRDADKEQIIALAKADPSVSKWLENNSAKKEIFVPGKLINFVV
jgi:leucyl-tRNA synthetase